MAECQEEVTQENVSDEDKTCRPEDLTQENVSDEDKTKSCDSCSFRGVGIQADTYCPVCAEYLCISCEKIHRSFKATRAHGLVQIEGSAKTLNKVTSPVTNEMMCEIHWSETVAEFCLTHEKVICRLCKTTKHRNCDISALGVVAENRKKSITTFLEDMKVLASEFQKIESSRQKDRRNILQISKSLGAKVERVKEEIVTWADKLKDVALEQIEKTKNDLLSKVDSQIAVAKEMTSLLATVKTPFEKIDNERLSDSFVLMTRTQQQIQEGTELKKELQKDMKAHTLSFYKSDKLSKLMSDISSFGTLEIEETRLIDFPEISKVTKKADIIVDSKLVTGCVFMPNGHLVICANHTVKVLTSEFTLKNELKCGSQVWDVAFQSTEEVIVTKPYSACLDVLNVSGTVRKLTSIPVEERCWGVDIKKGNIYVSCNLENGTGGNIKVFTLDGVCVNTFRIDEGHPYYLAVNEAGDRIIVCTGDTSKVLCIDMTGNSIFTYSDSQMKYPLGLLFDSHDNFMACADESNNVHVVKKDGTKHKILLSSDFGLYEPYCLAYRSTDKTLVVGQCVATPLIAFSIDI